MTYQRCDKGHRIYGEWCECQRSAPVGTDVHPLYNRKTKSWAGLPAGKRRAR